MSDWVAVQPLADDDLNRRYWSEPKIGDRVRVRLSGECRVTGLAKRFDGTVVWIDTHIAAENGQTGTVIECPFIARDGFCMEDSHRSVVQFDEHLSDPEFPCRVGHFAACELEPLP